MTKIIWKNKPEKTKDCNNLYLKNNCIFVILVKLIVKDYYYCGKISQNRFCGAITKTVKF